MDYSNIVRLPAGTLLSTDDLRRADLVIIGDDVVKVRDRKSGKLQDVFSEQEIAQLPPEERPNVPLVLHPGADGDDDGDGYIPRIALEHEGEGGHELYVIVGGETGGMVEHVPFEAMQQIAARLFTDDELRALRAVPMGDRFDARVLDSALAKIDTVLGDQ